MDAEVLHFGRGVKERVGPNADWGRTATSRTCLTPVNVDRWVIIFPEKSKDIAKQFARTWQQQGPRIGVQVANPVIKVRGVH